MWVGEVIGTNGDVLARYYLKQGQKCKVGRSIENNISFPADKSISRVHAEISVLNSSQIIVMDLASRFGTKNSEGKINPNVEVFFNIGDTVQFGAANQSEARMRFVRPRLSFCVTRLEKVDKDRLKKNAKLIGAKIVQEAETATHLVCSKYTATIKLLTAIVLNIKIVTCDWLIKLVETDVALPCVVVPKEEDFAPASDDLCAVTELSRSRATLYQDVVVFLLNEADTQYSLIMTKCGATVVRLFELETGGVDSDIVNKHAAKHIQSSASYGGVTECCIFFDESKGTAAPKYLVNSDSVVSWLTVETLAKAVMTCGRNPLSKDPPSQIRISASQSQAMQHQYGNSQRSTMAATNASQYNHTVGSYAHGVPSQIVDELPAPPAPVVRSTIESGGRAVSVAEKMPPTAVQGNTKPPTTGTKRPINAIHDSNNEDEPAGDKVQFDSECLFQQQEQHSFSVAPLHLAAKSSSVSSGVKGNNGSSTSSSNLVQQSIMSSFAAISATSAPAPKVDESGVSDVFMSPTKRMRREEPAAAATSKQVTSGKQPTSAGAGASSAKALLADSSEDERPAEPANKKAKTSPTVAPNSTTASSDATTTASVVSSTPKAKMASKTPIPSSVGKSSIPAAVWEEEGEWETTTAPATSTATTTPAEKTKRVTVPTAPTPIGEEPSSINNRYKSAALLAAEQAMRSQKSAAQLGAQTAAVNKSTASNTSKVSSNINANNSDAPVLDSLSASAGLSGSSAVSASYVPDSYDFGGLAASSAVSLGVDAVEAIVEPDKDNWYPVLRGMARLQVVQSKSHSREEKLLERQEQRRCAKKGFVPKVTATMQAFDEDVSAAAGRDEQEEDMVYSPAIVVEKPLVVRNRMQPNSGTSNNNNSSSNSSSSGNSSGTNRNMKTFRKNYVRTVDADEVLQARSMDKVLPKESERELQLRLEYDDLIAKEKKAEMMFGERFALTQQKARK